MADERWWIYRNDEVLGPYTEDQLINEEKVSPDSLVCLDGTEDWKPASDHPELKSLFGDSTDRETSDTTTVAQPQPDVPKPRIGLCLSRGWNLFKDNMKLLLGLAVLYVAVIAFGEFLGYLILEQFGSMLSLIWEIFTALLYSLLYLGFLKIGLNLLRGRTVNPTDIISQTDRLIPYVLAMILAVLMIGVGFIFFILPGLYLAVRFFFLELAIIDRNDGVIQSLKTSWVLTRGFNNTLYTFAFLLVLSLVNMIGALLLGVGLLVSGPVTLLALVEYYRGLKHASGKFGSEPTGGPDEAGDLGPTLRTG